MLTVRSGRVRAARRLSGRSARAEHRLFLAEGPRVVQEALTVPGCVVEVFALEGTERAHPEVYDAATAARVDWHRVDDSALAGLAQTVHPQGIVALCGFVDKSLASTLVGSPRLVAVCVDVRDPGNAGTVIRCADAAGADAVVLTGSSVDPYNGKAVRASAGSLFHLPLVTHPDPREAVDALRAAGLQVLAADGAAETDLDDAADDGLLAQPTAWLFGNEARGLPVDGGQLADRRVAVPLHGRAESLNLATAAAVCLYASARAQRPGAEQPTS